jgi:NitT/TauT family transport system ATP-binding protein
MKKSSSTPTITNKHKIKIGFVPVLDCAPLIIAEQKGFFKQRGLNIELSYEVGWATIREKLLYHQLDGAHALAGLFLAMRMGLSTQKASVYAPFIFNQNGNAITLSREIANAGVTNSKDLRGLIKSKPRKLTFGVVSNYSSHHFILRNWLKSNKINPDQDVNIVFIPPTQMVDNMKSGLLDGFCVGEPWNSAAVLENVGWIVATSQDINPGHPEKILMVREQLLTDYFNETSALVDALQEACSFCANLDARPEMIQILTRIMH